MTEATKPVTWAETYVRSAVGEMEELACEHSEHLTNPSRHHGAAAYYARAVHTCPGSIREAGDIYPICRKFAAFLLSDKPIFCKRCHMPFADRNDFVQVLGPVNT